jgi:hypothetical protein
VASATHTDLYLEPGVWDELRDSPAALELIRSTVLATPGVERVYDRDQLAEGGADLDAIGRRVALSFHPERSGDLVMVWKPYWLSSSAGSTHGTPRGYDRRVPVLLFGPGVVPGARLEPATPLDIVPTLALLAGVTPGESDGRVLIEALR